MVTEADIQALAAQIAAEFHPKRIVLFGSHAYGKPHRYSDVDLLVVEPLQGSSLRRAVEILARVDPPFSVDLIVRDPADVAMRYREHDALIRAAIDQGRVLYEEAA